MANTTQKKEEVKGHLNEAADKGREAAGAVGAAAGKAGEAARDVAGKAGDMARDAAGRVGDMAGDAAKAAGQKVDSVVSSAGEHVRTAADAVRQHGPKDGMLGGATRAVADTIESSGKYLEKEGFSGMFNDVTELVKRNPVPALFIGIGIGYLLGRALDRS